MKKSKIKKKLKLFLIVPVISFGLFVLFTFSLILSFIFTSPSPPDTPITYNLHASANILEQQSTPMDFFGDHSFCAYFTLPEVEIKNLIDKRFDWFTEDGRELPTTIEDWKEGQLNEELFQLTQGLCKKQIFNKSDIYKYLYKQVESEQTRLLVINEKQNIVYYYRNSW